MLVCLFPVGNRIEHQIILRSAVAKRQTRKKVYESLIDSDILSQDGLVIRVLIMNGIGIMIR